MIFAMYTIFQILSKNQLCFKNPDNPSCTDLFLTNRPKCFQGTMTMKTGISDFSKMVITVLKLFYKKKKQKLFTTETTKPSMPICLRKN